MNVPGCCGFPVVPCAVPVLPAMGSGDSNWITLALPPSALLLTLHWPLGVLFLHKHLYILCRITLKGAFLNTNDACGSTRTFKSWLFEARVPIVLIAEQIGRAHV